jgi:hypothetical protein
VLGAWALSAALLGLGCSGGSRAAGPGGGITYCGDSDVFQGGCGGTVSGSGSTPLGPFMPTAVRVTVAATCPATGVEHNLSSIDFQIGSGPDFARVTFNDQPDAGSVAFVGSHEIRARFTSFSPCAILPGGMSTTVTSVLTDGTAQITMGDDPNVAAAAGAGTVSGTFSFSGAGQSGSGSFSSPYCAFDPCPMMN